MIEPSAQQTNNEDPKQEFLTEAAADSFVDDAARASFSKTIVQMKKLVNSVRNLAQHAEDFFWQIRADSFNSARLSVLSPDLDYDTTGVNPSIAGAMKICMAAYPMLDEILEKFSLICSLEHAPLGTGKGNPPWLNGSDLIDEGAINTFHIDAVIGICDELDKMLEKLLEWNRNTDDFDSIAGIQKHYMSALIQMRYRVLTLLRHIGPLWPPVICSFSPYIRNTQSVYGSGNSVYPTHFSASFADTQSIYITLYHNAEIIPFREAFDVAAGEWLYNNELVAGAYDRDEWGAAYTTMSNGDKMYRAEGGLVLIETNGDVGIDAGVYEVLEIGDNLILRNKLLKAHSATTKKSESIEDITFRFRFLRKRREFYAGEGSPYDLVANIQYKADARLFQGSDFALNQRMNFVFTNVENQHWSPLPIEDNEEGIIKEHIWKGYNESGPVPDLNAGALISNLSEDTLYVLNTTEIEVVDPLSWSGWATDAIVAYDTNIYITGKFVKGSETANLLKLNSQTNELTKASMPEIEYAETGAVSPLLYDDRLVLYGSFF